eukprot:jgi/Astpho2/7068/Aster-01907
MAHAQQVLLLHDCITQEARSDEICSHLIGRHGAFPKFSTTRSAHAHGCPRVPKRMAADALMPLAEPGVTRGVLRLLVVEGRSMPAHPASRWKKASDIVHPILGNHFGHHKEKAAPAEKAKVKTRGDVASEIIDAKHHELTQPQNTTVAAGELGQAKHKVTAAVPPAGSNSTRLHGPQISNITSAKPQADAAGPAAAGKDSLPDMQGKPLSDAAATGKNATLAKLGKPLIDTAVAAAAGKNSSSSSKASPGAAAAGKNSSSSSRAPPAANSKPTKQQDTPQTVEAVSVERPAKADLIQRLRDKVLAKQAKQAESKPSSPTGGPGRSGSAREMAAAWIIPLSSRHSSKHRAVHDSAVEAAAGPDLAADSHPGHAATSSNATAPASSTNATAAAGSANAATRAGRVRGGRHNMTSTTGAHLHPANSISTKLSPPSNVTALSSSAAAGPHSSTTVANETAAAARHSNLTAASSSATAGHHSSTTAGRHNSTLSEARVGGHQTGSYASDKPAGRHNGTLPTAGVGGRHTSGQAAHGMPGLHAPAEEAAGVGHLSHEHTVPNTTAAVIGVPSAEAAEYRDAVQHHNTTTTQHDNAATTRHTHRSAEQQESRTTLDEAGILQLPQIDHVGAAEPDSLAENATFANQPGTALALETAEVSELTEDSALETGLHNLSARHVPRVSTRPHHGAHPVQERAAEADPHPAAHHPLRLEQDIAEQLQGPVQVTRQSVPLEQPDLALHPRMGPDQSDDTGLEAERRAEAAAAAMTEAKTADTQADLAAETKVEGSRGELGTATSVREAALRAEQAAAAVGREEALLAEQAAAEASREEELLTEQAAADAAAAVETDLAAAQEAQSAAEADAVEATRASDAGELQATAGEDAAKALAASEDAAKAAAGAAHQAAAAAADGDAVAMEAQTAAGQPDGPGREVEMLQAEASTEAIAAATAAAAAQAAAEETLKATDTADEGAAEDAAARAREDADAAAQAASDAAFLAGQAVEAAGGFKEASATAVSANAAAADAAAADAEAAAAAAAAAEAAGAAAVATEAADEQGGEGTSLDSVQHPGTEAGAEHLEGAAVERTGAEAEQEAKSQDEPASKAAETTPITLSLTDSQEAAQGQVQEHHREVASAHGANTTNARQCPGNLGHDYVNQMPEHCSDVTPDPAYTCDQQCTFEGTCGTSYYTTNGFCEYSCGVCDSLRSPACTNVPPPASKQGVQYTCYQQVVVFGHSCENNEMLQAPFCNSQCGRCAL